MEAKDDAMAQRCGVCGHDHEQGVKCPICGHTGKSRSYKCFKMPFTAFEFTVQSFDCQGQDAAVAGSAAALERANLALWTFVKILRGRIFPNMAKALPDDPMSRHLVAFVGDGPIGVARWRPASEESGGQVAIVEHFGVVESKRRQGYATRFLRAVVEDIEAIYAQQPTHPQALVAYVPQTDSFAAMKLFQSVGFQPAAQVEVVEESAFLRMRMAWGCNRS
ncbi:hypothetical protein PF010_g9231 [Phytophthora fragariae]|uniref:N-acetyltransferase domain-containing protein n=1 Tax=Phytophthora fragariae TaxID=53985 RepID=A0A6A3L294_9STRA|nr:hypothetical protein PF011_g9080 [Phytophthora fragariae]KAE9115719.1 hypothetical protein PF010_g9231 [Phytophthora fragariae]KAE9235647.1 hypothetical protein PF004_g9056 [Phytophthora fragariae]KAE9344001.1 hypothetical protein PF008_g9431 [Phytophthora fragariae]